GSASRLGADGPLESGPGLNPWPWQAQRTCLGHLVKKRFTGCCGSMRYGPQDNPAGRPMSVSFSWGASWRVRRLMETVKRAKEKKDVDDGKKARRVIPFGCILRGI